MVFDYLGNLSITATRRVCKVFRDASPAVTISVDREADPAMVTVAHVLYVDVSGMSKEKFLRVLDLDKYPRATCVVLSCDSLSPLYVTPVECADVMRRCLRGKPGRNVHVVAEVQRIYTIAYALMNHPRVVRYTGVANVANMNMQRYGDYWEDEYMYGYDMDDVWRAGGLYTCGFWNVRHILRELPTLTEDDMVEDFVYVRSEAIRAYSHKVLLKHLNDRLFSLGHQTPIYEHDYAFRALMRALKYDVHASPVYGGGYEVPRTPEYGDWPHDIPYDAPLSDYL